MPFHFDEEAVERYLRTVKEARARGIPEVSCLTLEGAAPTIIVFDTEATCAGDLATAWLPLEEPAVRLDLVIPLVIDVAQAFGASNARVEDDRLALRYQGRRAAERAREATPPELRQFLPDLPDVPAELLLPDLLVPQEYDRAEVPPGVWWVNYWGPRQVTALGEERVRTAEWAQIVETGHRALMLVATEEPLDPDSPQHISHLRQLLDHLQLRHAQEAARCS